MAYLIRHQRKKGKVFAFGAKMLRYERKGAFFTPTRRCFDVNRKWKVFSPSAQKTGSISFVHSKANNSGREVKKYYKVSTNVYKGFYILRQFFAK
jgi:hypothetical protein